MSSPHSDKPTLWQPWHRWAFLGFVLLLSYFTYFHRYTYPPYVYWDENYHIASAQKYLHGTYFMEQHPPLGKLLIAAGEAILRPNPQSDQYLGTDYATNFPEGFSFAGYRMFPAMLAWFTAPLLFGIFYLLSRRNPLNATLLSFLYIFDNALIVHHRGAMLEGPFLFFCALNLFAFLLLWHETSKKKFIWWSVLFGASFAALVTTKVLGLALILLLPAIAWRLLTSRRDLLMFSGIVAAFLFPFIAYISVATYLELIQVTVQWPSPWTVTIFTGLMLIGFVVLLWKLLPRSRAVSVLLMAMIPAFLIVYCSVWYVHFATGKAINPSLPDQGYYQASEEYKGFLAEGTTAGIAAFPYMLRDSLKYVTFYNAGAPRLDLCKTDENGSPWFFWPLGARSINYRWATPGQLPGQSADQQTYSYLYLQANPVIWWSALLGLLMAAGICFAYVFFPTREPFRNLPLLGIFFGIYLSFCIAVSQIGRVLYLYHYFLPLMLSFLVLAIVIDNIGTVWKWKVTEQGRTFALMAFAFLIFAGFQFYRPLTYYEPITNAQVERRALLPLWGLHCVNCERNDPLVVPFREPGK